jgi:poly-beta-1,6-N-acetyl-D-glucosamine synthase
MHSREGVLGNLLTTPLRWLVRRVRTSSPWPRTSANPPRCIGLHEGGLLDRYDYIAIVDDDTLIAPSFLEEALKRFDDRTVIVVGKTITNWTHEHRWNPWLAGRAYSYWRYQVTIRPGQDVFNALNCISGSNSVYRSTLLREVLVERTPYIVDDTYWLLETQRRKLGRVRYAPDAHAYIQDPTTFHEWYRQNLRWLWGTCQGIIGHRVGRRRTWFDFWYCSLIFDWVLYVLFWPIVAAVLLVNRWVQLETMVVAVSLAYGVWVTAAAVALRKWRLVALSPFIVVFDWLYRINFAHAAVKAIRQPVVSTCRWESPTRY